MATDLATVADNVTDLEVRLAYQDRVIAALDDVVRALHDRVDKLEKELRELRAGAPTPIEAVAEPPPHY